MHDRPKKFNDIEGGSQGALDEHEIRESRSQIRRSKHAGGIKAGW
jgi:hypothetical protein